MSKKKEKKKLKKLYKSVNIEFGKPKKKYKKMNKRFLDTLTSLTIDQINNQKLVEIEEGNDPKAIVPANYSVIPEKMMEKLFSEIITAFRGEGPDMSNVKVCQMDAWYTYTDDDPKEIPQRLKVFISSDIKEEAE